MKYVCYRDLIGVTHTEEEAKAEAAEVRLQFIDFILIHFRVNDISINVMNKC
jgi:hypothetical protein